MDVRAALESPAPWLAPYDESRRRILAAGAGGLPIADVLNGALAARAPTIELAAGPLKFVAHDALPDDEPYEAFIARTACVPTRDNLHDLFNALVWMTFPRLKRRLNALQSAEIAHSGIGPTRGPVRDALTLLDENGALWQPTPALHRALERRDWQALFAGQRAEWAQAPLVLFGHALLEKLVHPRKPMTAHVCVAAPGADYEGELLQRLSPAWLAAKPFLPLPVLGVPGWWPPNESAGFYDDPTVFRPLTRGP